MLTVSQLGAEKKKWRKRKRAQERKTDIIT
jgi:hypothetical protein